MAGANFTSSSIPAGSKAFNGGLNSTAGALELQDNESSDLLNVDFDKFGSILKRNGYAALNTGSIALASCDGLWWYEANLSGVATRYLINITNSKFYYMNNLAGVWSDTTGGVSISSANHCDFENFLNNVYFTNGVDTPKYWAGSGTVGTMAVPTNLTSAKYVKQFNNYLFLGNVVVNSVYYPSRIYWSHIKDTTLWDADQFIEISKDDGQEITGLKVLHDRLVVYKHRAIYNVFFSGDADLPFIMPGGGKSNSVVGCISPFSIQEVENGHVFLAHDGLYYYDGDNSYKLSYRISKTLTEDMSITKVNDGVSLVHKDKNRYMLALSSAGKTTHDRVIVWDYFNNAFSVYSGINASAMTSVFVSGFQERPYFADYNGITYQMDTGTDDYPYSTATTSLVQTAINGYYYTNWKTYEDLCDQKGIPHTYIYYQSSNSVLTFSYSYDFETSDQYTQTLNLASGVAVYGTAIYGTDIYCGTGGASQRRDLTGRGRVVRFKYGNNTIGETFQIDGMGSFVHAETNV